MAKTVKVEGGSIKEYENGSYRRSYGVSIVSAYVSGDTVIAKNAFGRTEEWENGGLRRSYV